MNSSRQIKAILGIVLALACAGAVFAFIYQKTQTIKPELQEEIGDKRLTLLRKDAALRQSVMNVRYNMVYHYDELVNLSRGMERLVQSWEQDLGSFAPMAETPLQGELLSLQHNLEMRSHIMDRFKSHNAALKSSLLFVPMAERRLTYAVGNDPRYAKLHGLSEEVVFRTLMYGSLWQTEHEVALQDGVEELLKELKLFKGEGATARDAEVVRRAEVVLLHARSCMKEVPAVEGYTKEMLDTLIVPSVEKIAALQEKRVEAADAEAENYRIALYGFSGFLLLCLLVVGYKLSHIYGTLEHRVAARTKELEGAHRELTEIYQSNRLVFDNVDQGLLTIDTMGEMNPERTLRVEHWFGDPGSETHIVSYLKTVNAEFAEWFEINLEALRDSLMPIEVSLDQMPSRMEHRGRTYSWRYTPIMASNNETVEKILLLISDISDLVKKEKSEAQQKQLLEAFGRIMKDRPGFVRFYHEAHSLVRDICNADEQEIARQKQLIHTLKGNCAIFGFHVVSNLCHDLEEELCMRDTALSSEETERLRVAWDGICHEIDKMLGRKEDRFVEVAKEDYNSLQDALYLDVSKEKIKDLVDGWKKESSSVCLERLAEQMRGMAERMGKDIRVITLPDETRLDPDEWTSFWSSFVHVMRNALDHGIETKEDRRKAGKPAQGCVTLRTCQIQDRFIVQISDDGRGVQWDKVADKAREMGRPSETHDDLVEALFHNGLSTRQIVTEYSGRGVGMAAVRSACELLGGSVLVSSASGAGTDFIFSFPLKRVLDGERRGEKPFVVSNESQAEIQARESKEMDS